ncbi:MAG TPA: Ig-like domain repeat protein, partial [Terriglobales bacterium]
MKIARSRSVLAAVLFTMTGSALTGTAFAQQVTYYDFDTPQATAGQMSRQCPASAAPTGTLFCFNDGTGKNANPSFLSDTYPPLIDPVTTDNPAMSSTHYAVQMTQAAANQGSSMWFSVPQKISNGFTAYFAFKFTPDPNSFATADGVAFVIQNSAGGGSDALGCAANGAGLNIVGASGGCMGYGGIDNSLAIEFDTYRNPWDPTDISSNTGDDNHVAIMNCGPGLPNSPDHTGPCQVNLNLNGQSMPALIDPAGITLADGKVHQVVVEYSGPTEATPNLLQIFIDPPFVAGTHTPAPAAVPVLSGVYNIAENVNLMNSGSANDSAYVGFTSATGGADEQHEVMAWTFTPHTPSTQEQPISPPGTPTVFPFGSHVYAVTYPPDSPTPPPGIDIVITANPITPQLFSQLVSGGPFAGSQCQVYDDTGGKCIVYSASCIDTASNTIVSCPSTTPTDPITVKTAFDNTVQPLSPGFIQGDPFYSPVATISGDGTTATVTCTGDCSVTPGQTVTVVGSSNAGFNGTITVLAASASTPNIFTYASTASGTGNGGYLTTNNLKNIFVSYSPQRIDGSISGRTLNFGSDFIATSVTTVPTFLSISAPSAPFGKVAPVTVTATSANGTPPGSVSLSVDGGTPITVILSSNGTSTFSLKGLTGGNHSLAVTYATHGSFQGNTATGSITITPIAPTVALTGLPAGNNRLQLAQTVMLNSVTNASTLPVFTASGSCSVHVYDPSHPTSASLVTTATPGICSVTVAWGADSNYTAASITDAVDVGLTPTSVSVNSGLSTTSIGMPVSFTVTVTGSGLPSSPQPPTGQATITSSIAGDPSCTAIFPGGSGATSTGVCSLTFLTAGQRTLTASYAGDSFYSGGSGKTQLSVSSVPLADINPGSVDFGKVFQGQVIPGQIITLTNNGSTP